MSHKPTSHVVAIAQHWRIPQSAIVLGACGVHRTMPIRSPCNVQHEAESQLCLDGPHRFRSVSKLVGDARCKTNDYDCGSKDTTPARAAFVPHYSPVTVA